MKSDNARRQLDDHIIDTFDFGATVTYETALRAVECSEAEETVRRIDRIRKDRKFLEELRDRFDNRENSCVRQMMTDWLEELERLDAELTRELNR